MLLALDTATQNASVALYDPRQVWAERCWFSDHNHTIELMPAVQAMLTQLQLSPADLKGVAVALGPGSFTGMRIGLSVAKGLALALRIPIVGVHTLDILAHPFSELRRPTCAFVRAGRGRYCAAIYSRTRRGWGREGDFHLVNPGELAELAPEGALFCGELDAELRAAIEDRWGPAPRVATPAQALRRASVLAELAWERVAAGQGDNLTTLSPVYLQRAGPIEVSREGNL